ncbi:MAG TPA: thiamine pyrophosphate-binding protein [Xanthobacteraceae bacterium]|nr:thiamine pyrophosphate-binding protein [Xanthobacteraceae bacterium]
MGDGNMHWATAMKNLPGMQSIFARHEHCACAMAMGYHSATGKVGVASVTCGPGFTQITTALAVASRNRVPLVVFAGEVPINARWYSQAIDQAPIATAAGAHYIAAHAPSRMYQYVREAFHVARHERRPVVLGVPYDLQKQPLPDIGSYEPSSAVLPRLEPVPPNSRQIAQLAEKLANARCPIILAGRGVLRAGASADVEELAELSGALLATTLPMRGLFDHNPFSLGIFGGYAREIALEMGAKADLVVAIGASLHGRRRPHVSEGRGGADRHRSTRPAARPQGRRSLPLRRRQARNGRNHQGAAGDRRGQGERPLAGACAPHRRGAGGQRELPDRARHARPPQGDRGARSGHPQGFRLRERVRPPILFPLDHARTPA